jgi:Domain of unknown function (DUF4440)
MRLRRIAWSLFALAFAAPLPAQTARDSVVAAVETFFRTMTARDSAGAAAVMRPDGVFHSIRYGADSVVIRTSPHTGYLATVARREGLVERMWNPTVLIQKDLATVWAPYDFHIAGKFSHCGVDSFLLVREKGRWRVLSGAYTVEPTGCAPSPLGPLKP